MYRDAFSQPKLSSRNLSKMYGGNLIKLKKQNKSHPIIKVLITAALCTGFVRDLLGTGAQTFTAVASGRDQYARLRMTGAILSMRIGILIKNFPIFF